VDANGIHIDTSSTSIDLNNINGTALMIYPNPSSGNILLYYKTEKQEIMEVSVYNISGKPVLQIIITTNPDQLVFGLDLSSHPRGLYFIRISSKSANYTAKIIIE
jgi:hypothetical protein